MLPGLLSGGVAGLLALVCPGWNFLPPLALPIFWLLAYGCALTAAGFFMHRGIKLLGWIFVFCGCALMAVRGAGAGPALTEGHAIMGGTFGGLHLAYGIYLYFTEPRGNGA
jgi:hypothetical protein